MGEEGTPRAGDMVEREIPEEEKDGMGEDAPSSVNSEEELMVVGWGVDGGLLVLSVVGTV